MAAAATAGAAIAMHQILHKWYGLQGLIIIIIIKYYNHGEDSDAACPLGIWLLRIIAYV
jgi:hypothetical protein